MTTSRKDKDGGTSTKQKLASAGVKTCVARRELSHKRYLEVLNGEVDMIEVSQTTIQSRKHQLFTEKQTRVGLFAADDKRWILPNHTTRALGHYRNGA